MSRVLEDYKDVLTCKQVAEILSISPATVHELIGKGSLYAVKVGKNYRIPKIKVLEYLGILEGVI